MKATLSTFTGLALLVSCGTAMGQSPMASGANYNTKALEQQVYRGLSSFAANDGYAVDSGFVEININQFGVTAIAPYYTDMLDIDLSTDFNLGAVYYQSARTPSGSLSSGHYTLVLGPSETGQPEFQLRNAQDQTVQSTPAKIEVMGSQEEVVEASIRATGDAVVSSVHGACWLTYSNGSTAHGHCWLTPIEEIQ